MVVVARVAARLDATRAGRVLPLPPVVVPVSAFDLMSSRGSAPTEPFREGARRHPRHGTCQHDPVPTDAVPSPLDDLIDLLDLEDIEVNIFRGHSPDEKRQRVFGGQVAGQALVAAARTVEHAPDDGPPRFVHSLHAYFLRPGDPNAPILYEVDRIRDGQVVHHASRRRDPARQGDLQPAGELPRARGRSRLPAADARRRARPRDASRLQDADGAVTGGTRRLLRPASPDRLAPRRPDARGAP